MKKLTKILVLILITVSLLIFSADKFKIHTIDCKISLDNCGQTLYKKLEKLKNKSIFLVNIEQELSAQEFNSETALLESYSKRLPSTVILNFNNEKVLYQINVGDKIFYISEFGNILANNQGIENLITVFFSPEIKNPINDTSVQQSKHQQIVEIINSLDNNKNIIKKVNWKKNEEIILEISGGPEVIIDEETIKSRLKSLQLLLDSREIKNYEEPI